MPHSHSSGGCSGGCDHNAAGQLGEEFGVQYSLYQKIDLSNMECLNESEEGGGKRVFRPWQNRLDKGPSNCVISDCDEELLFNIPFTGNIKLKGIIIIGGEDDTHPTKLRLFKNRPHMTFDAAGSKADQEFDLVRDEQGVVEYNPKVVTFSSVHHLSLHIPSNFGADETKIYWIGLKGEYTEAQRTGVVNAVYEARPMMQDHKQDSGAQENFSRGPQC